MHFATWQDLYKSDWQAVAALVVVPALFLIYLAAVERPARSPIAPAAARFVHLWAVVFAVLTIVDPLAVGPLLRLLHATDAPIASVIMVAFVMIGDFRVYLLVFTSMSYAGARHDARKADPLHAARDALHLVPPRAAAAAAVATTIVPLSAYAVDALLRARDPGLPEQTLWLAYELLFLAIALALLGWVVPARVPPASSRLRNYLRAVLVYVAAYYALWAGADVLILAGFDVGWALRIVPNQLYYALFVPFAYWRFFSTPRPTARR